jgi:hypothetical protein
MRWWWERVLVASGTSKRRFVPLYTGTAGVRCTRSGEEERAGGSSGLVERGGVLRV